MIHVRSLRLVILSAKVMLVLGMSSRFFEPYGCITSKRCMPRTETPGNPEWHWSWKERTLVRRRGCGGTLRLWRILHAGCRGGTIFQRGNHEMARFLGALNKAMDYDPNRLPQNSFRWFIVQEHHCAMYLVFTMYDVGNMDLSVWKELSSFTNKKLHRHGTN